MIWLLAFSTVAEAQNAQPLLLKFNSEPIRLERRGKPIEPLWSYYVTEPGDVATYLKRPGEVGKYIPWSVDDNESACRLLSRDNYVGLCRLIPPQTASFRRLSWQWKVDKHPSNGILDNKQFDAAITLCVFFRTPDDEYSGLGFCWSNGTKKKQQLVPKHKMSWSKSMTADFFYLSLRDGALEGLYSEEVNLADEYQKAFHKVPPPIWAIALVADSNDSLKRFNQMTTDAFISDIQLKP